MEFLLGLMTGIAIGFIWGVWRATQSFIERIINQPEEIKELMSRVNTAVQKDRDESNPKSSKDYRTEWHHGQCYLYDANDNFLAQGESIIEAMDRAEKRFPGLKLHFELKTPEQSNQ